jgi:hypothetical protein
MTFENALTEYTTDHIHDLDTVCKECRDAEPITEKEKQDMRDFYKMEADIKIIEVCEVVMKRFNEGKW